MSVSEACKCRGIVGYLSIDFVTFIHPVTDVQQLWAVGLHIGYTDSHAMIQMMLAMCDGTIDVQSNKLKVSVPVHCYPIL